MNNLYQVTYIEPGVHGGEKTIYVVAKSMAIVEKEFNETSRIVEIQHDVKILY